jgi:hypothetical protein
MTDLKRTAEKEEGRFPISRLAHTFLEMFGTMFSVARMPHFLA